VRKYFWLAFSFVICLGIEQPAQAAVTYVDAIGGFGGNTVRASNGSPDDFFATNSTSATDGRWNFRDAQGHLGIFESPNTGTGTVEEDAPELKTTATGLANGTYDVFVFFRSENDGTPADDWRVRAGFTSNPGANPLYGRTTAGGATAGSLALPPAITALEFTPGTQPNEDSPQLLFYANIGQFTVTDGTLSVFIDDLPSVNPNRLALRTWYEGIGYGVEAPVLEINSVTSGLASTAATWSNNQPPSAANNYNVLATHTVTVAEAFPGKKLAAKSGGTVNISATNVDFKRLTIEAGGALTESVVGDFILGAPTDPSVALGVLELQGDVALNVGAGETMVIGLAVHGTGNMDLNTGAGSIVRLADSELHEGVIRFNGTGSEFTLEWNRDFHHVEMNSTGANKFSFLQQGQVDNGIIVFNQPGTLAHATPVTSPLSRLIAFDELEVNAPITVEVSADYTAGANSERRLQVSQELRGAANITVVGSGTDPSSLAAGVGLHEFELGGSGEPAAGVDADPYSGQITAGGFVNMELRHSLPAARIVVNQNARFEMGHDELSTTNFTEFGEVQVNSGGTLEIGHEDNISAATGHAIGHLRLVNTDGRSGNLSLAAGSKTTVQVNGLGANQFDTVEAQGSITLGGLLEVWVNPANTTDNVITTYVPAVNDEFVIMSIVGSPVPTDFNDSGTVDSGDLTVWKESFNVDADGDADGDGDSDGADFLSWQQTVGATSGGGGTITGNFADVVAPAELAWPAGLDFTTVVVGNQVILRVTSAATAAAAAVPEPSAVLLAAAGGLGLVAVRRRRGAR
jgi:hypothetical protein